MKVNKKRNGEIGQGVQKGKKGRSDQGSGGMFGWQTWKARRSRARPEASEDPATTGG